MMATPHAIPDALLPVELPETDQFSPRTFDADDEFLKSREPARSVGRLGKCRARPG